MFCSCVVITPQTGGSVKASPAASGWEHVPGTADAIGGIARCWFDWAPALHASAIRAQGAVTHMLTRLVQGKLIGAFQILSQSTLNHSQTDKMLDLLCEMGINAKAPFRHSTSYVESQCSDK